DRTVLIRSLPLVGLAAGTSARYVWPLLNDCRTWSIVTRLPTLGSCKGELAGPLTTLDHVSDMQHQQRRQFDFAPATLTDAICACPTLSASKRLHDRAAMPHILGPVAVSPAPHTLPDLQAPKVIDLRDHLAPLQMDGLIDSLEGFGPRRERDSQQVATLAGQT